MKMFIEYFYKNDKNMKQIKILICAKKWQIVKILKSLPNI